MKNAAPADTATPGRAGGGTAGTPTLPPQRGQMNAAPALSSGVDSSWSQNGQKNRIATVTALPKPLKHFDARGLRLSTCGFQPAAPSPPGSPSVGHAWDE